jgi:CHASE2 domain-containing sensor protein
MERGGFTYEWMKKFQKVWRSPYWGKLYAAKWVILGISISMFLLSWAGMLEHMETSGLDTFNIRQAPKDPSKVVIIAIDDEDYKTLFGETSPLDSGVLQDLLCAIAEAKPKVIAVDIDTSAPGFRAIHTESDWPAIVWGRDALWNGKAFHVLPVLGGQNPERNLDGVAIAQFPTDTDGIVRRYHRTLPVESGVMADSLPWAVAKAACPDPASVKGCKAIQKAEETRQANSERALILNFAGERFSFKPLSASKVLQAMYLPGWKTDSPLRGQIVLVGGIYHAARDIEVTPVGQMFGVQLVAQAAETELNGGGIRPMNEIVAFVLDLLSGASLIYINYRNLRNLRRALTLSLAGLVILPLISSYLAFSTLSRWFNFVPMIVGVLLHELYEHAREYYRLREKYVESQRVQAQTGAGVAQ